MIIKIEVFGQKNFTKTGKLKKKTHTDMSRMLADVEPVKEDSTELFLKETAKQFKRYYTDFESPYIFTHIKARKIDTGEPVFIFESVMVGSDYVTTSPIKLRDYLTK